MSVTVVYECTHCDMNEHVAIQIDVNINIIITVWISINCVIASCSFHEHPTLAANICCLATFIKAPPSFQNCCFRSEYS